MSTMYDRDTIHTDHTVPPENRDELAPDEFEWDGTFDVGTMNPDYDRPHYRDGNPTDADIDLLLDGNPFDLDELQSPFQLFIRFLLNLVRLPVILVRMVKEKIDMYRMNRDMERNPAFAWIRANRPLRIHRGKVRLSDLSTDKRFVLQKMTDDEVSVMLSNTRRQPKPVQNGKEEVAGDLLLDEETMAKVRAYRGHQLKLDAQETRWLTTVERLLHCRYQKPQGFDGMTVQQIYRKLYDYLTEHHLPGAFVESIVPALVYYVMNGSMRRAIMIVGNPGCGKTTAAKVIADALGMASYHFDATSKDTSHGLLGEGKAYQSCEYGELIYGVCKTGVVNPLLHIDEQDKTSTPTTRASFQDELLPLCDGAHETYTDNFLRFPMPLKGIIFIFTVNTTDTVSPALLDRCEVIHFKDIEEDRVQAIIDDYAKEELQTLLYQGVLTLDHKALHQAVATLYKSGIHSVRQHQKMVDNAFRAAFNDYVFRASDDGHAVIVDDALYSDAMRRCDYITAKKAGF